MADVRRVRLDKIITDKKKLTAKQQIKLDKTIKKILDGKQQKERIVISENYVLLDGYILFLAYESICKDLTLEVLLQKTV